MYVLNSSKIVKNLRIKKITISFPPGVSQQPETQNILNYVTSHRDLSVFKDPPKKEKPKPKKKERKSKKEENLEPKKKDNNLKSED